MGYTRTRHGTGIEVVEYIRGERVAVLHEYAKSEDVLDQADTISLSDYKEELSARRKAFLYE